jgi:hypothetical protein
MNFVRRGSALCFPMAVFLRWRGAHFGEQAVTAGQRESLISMGLQTCYLLMGHSM